MSASTVEVMIEEYVNKGVKWEELPDYVKNQLGNSQELYNQEIKNYSMSRMISYESSLCALFMSKQQYYSDMVNFLRTHLRVFPYQFSDFVVNEAKILPFQFYSDMLFDIMKSEKSYDILPNFTAGDVNRILGIGRNQYIDIMNKVRAKKWLWKLSKSIVKELLPQQPIVSPIEYWWIVEHFPLPQQEFLKIFNQLSEQEQYAIGTVKKEGKVLACKLPYDALLSIYRRGLVHFHVPIDSNDLFIVPPLQGFIMNRTTNDHFEKLLYMILVTIDERTSVAEVAKIIEVDVESVKAALSLCCRLNFAKKKLLPKPQNLHETSEDQYHNSWQKEIELYYEQLKTYSLTMKYGHVDEGNVNEAKQKRIAFMFDSSLTAYLMMGNLAEGLKNHAVTLFEVGKMPDELLDDFLNELDKIRSLGEGEGEARRYYRAALSLRSTLRWLRKNKNFSIPNCDGSVDMIRCESLTNLDPQTRLRILNANYAVLITVAPLGAGTLQLPAMLPGFYGPPIPQVSTPWFKLYTYACAGCGTPSILFSKGQRLRKLPQIIQNCDKVMVSSWEQEYNVMNSLILLQVLNEALISSPNLVQVYEIDETKPAEIFDISFPYENVSEDDLISFISGNGENNKEKQQPLNSDELVSANRPNIEEIESNSNRELDKDSKVIVHTDAEKQQIAAIMQRLTQKLHLDCSFGFVRMMKVQKPTAKECTIYPLEIFFGIPLGDEQMNAQVSNLIVKKNLFGEENLAKHTENMKLLSTEFMRFVEANLDSSLKVGTEESEPNLFPTKNVYFDGTKITPLLF